MINNIKSSLISKTKNRPKKNKSSSIKESPLKNDKSRGEVHLSNKAQKMLLSEKKVNEIKQKIASGEYEMNISSIAKKVFSRL